MDGRTGWNGYMVTDIDVRFYGIWQYHATSMIRGMKCVQDPLSSLCRLDCFCSATSLFLEAIEESAKGQ